MILSLELVLFARYSRDFGSWEVVQPELELHSQADSKEDAFEAGRSAVQQFVRVLIKRGQFESYLASKGVGVTDTRDYSGYSTDDGWAIGVCAVSFSLGKVSPSWEELKKKN